MPSLLTRPKPIEALLKNLEKSNATHLFHPVILKEMLKRFILIITLKSAAALTS
jgi:hypothetical protein